MPETKFEISIPSDQTRDSCSQRGGSKKFSYKVDQLESGVYLLTLQCDKKSVELLISRGMGIFQATNDGVRFGWDSPVAKPVHPSQVPISEPSGLGWLDGFNEMMVRCGLTSNGAPEFAENGQLLWPLHGRIANIPATELSVTIDEDAGRITATGSVYEARFHFYRWQLTTEVSLQVGSDEIHVSDRVTNLSNRTCGFQLLYHNNFGSPILESGSTIHAPANRVFPRNQHAARGIANWNHCGAPDPGYAEEVFFLDLEADDSGQSMVVLSNADKSKAASVRYETKNMPCFSLWKNTVGLQDGYVVGLEPATNFPNPRSFEEKHGRVVNVQSQQSVEFDYWIGMHVGSESVSDAIGRVNAIRSGQPELATEPHQDWSAPES